MNKLDGGASEVKMDETYGGYPGDLSKARKILLQQMKTLQEESQKDGMEPRELAAMSEAMSKLADAMTRLWQ